MGRTQGGEGCLGPPESSSQPSDGRNAQITAKRPPGVSGDRRGKYVPWALCSVGVRLPRLSQPAGGWGAVCVRCGRLRTLKNLHSWRRGSALGRPVGGL